MEIKGLKIFFKNSLYTILKRKKISKKPIYYLLDVKKKEYLSSLYPVDNNTFIFDDKIDRYKIIFYEDSGEIKYEIKRLSDVTNTFKEVVK